LLSINFLCVTLSHMSINLRNIFDMGVDLLIIEHNMDVVMKLSDRITVISFGRKIAEGTPEEIKNNDDVISAYLGARFKKE